MFVKFFDFKIPYVIAFLHFFVRPVWSFVFNIFLQPFYLALYLFSKKHRNKYKENKKIWGSISDIDQLIRFFKENVKYKWDGPIGLMDHDNSKLEFFMEGFDCDDAGRYPFKKIKEKKLADEAYWVGMIGNSIKSWHYDCVFRINKTWFLFNQGEVITGATPKEVIDELSNYYFTNPITGKDETLFPKGKTKVFCAKKWRKK